MTSNQAGPSGTSGNLKYTARNNGIIRHAPVLGTTTPPLSSPQRFKKRSPHPKKTNTASPLTPGRTQPLSYYLQTVTTEAEFQSNPEESPTSAVQQNRTIIPVANSLSTAQTPPSSSIMHSIAASPHPSKSSAAHRAALAAHSQAQDQQLPPQDVFLNLFEAMRSSVSDDFQQQYNAYQMIIADLQKKNERRLEDAEKQAAQLRERLLCVEKLRGEDRGRWEVERKNLMRQLEQGENEVERQEREKIQKEEMQREKEVQDRIHRKLVEKYEAKKKAWTTERHEMKKKLEELEQENRRLEDVITSDDQLLEKHLQEFEEERKQTAHECRAWEIERDSLDRKLCQAQEAIEKERNQRLEAITTLSELQQQNEDLQQEKEILSTQYQWQKDKWEEERSIMVARLEEEKRNSTRLSYNIQEHEAKRKRGIDGNGMTWARDVKKAKLADHGDEDEVSESGIEGTEGEDVCSEGGVEWERTQKKWEDVKGGWEAAHEEWERAHEGFNRAKGGLIRAGKVREEADEEHGETCSEQESEQDTNEEEQERAVGESDGAETESEGTEEVVNEESDDSSDEQGFSVSRHAMDDGW